MKVFFDLEFTGLRQKTTPISLAMATKYGDEFYAEFSDFDRSQVDEWLESNVLCNLVGNQPPKDFIREKTTFIHGTYETIAEAARTWLIQRLDNIRMVGDCLAYDWVLFCELFGGALRLPKNVSYIPIELCTALELEGIDPDGDRDLMRIELCNAVGFERGEKHNALHDVRVMLDIWSALEYRAAGRKMKSENIYYAVFG